MDNGGSSRNGPSWASLTSSTGGSGYYVPQQQLSPPYTDTNTIRVEQYGNPVEDTKIVQDDDALEQEQFEPALSMKEKNTFVHVDKPVGSLIIPTPEYVSSPAIVMESTFKTNHPSMEERHKLGTCKPCAYFLYKADGCRNSETCEFCHLCRRGEIKKRKKEKVKQLRAEEAAMKEAEVENDEHIDEAS
mmetsp:Transcript_17700/g.28762  ORF Transcript_17700/g.28762 Transcript_17700/m.28762 type:complete len:189 (-) Transcript_17700:229-795(-)|eukprot:CAMPEP_0169099838 /NCGR_PEP_ID=MMETSP1015-20121227/20768_1 /TAXON_ID=342587 /ORGANISM="Karlodinium micrum, Strain CCMP2283" /LENGTH=188 /DNA_ID=CAMNT_0009160741 /DNA_START=215 /DNA_END=781 /DNA_ORIENTATION=-